MSPPVTRLDHLVVAASTLEEGVKYVRDALGVTVPPGGRHANMATHNRVMALGPDIYLEIIAIDPDGTPPHHPRWFGLDDPHVRHSLSGGPGLLTWAANTTDISALTATNPGLGEVHALQRDQLAWQAALTPDGHLPAGGFLPLVIQWQTEPHPAGSMADLGCRLTELRLYHPRKRWLLDRLADIGIENGDPITVTATRDDETPRLEAVIDTPDGPATLPCLSP